MLAITRYYKPSIEVQFSPDAARGILSGSAPAAAIDPLIIQSVGGVGIRVGFSVSRTDNQAPNRGSLRLYNLDQTRLKAIGAAISAGRIPVVSVSIGYEGSNACIFNGEIRKFVPDDRNEANVITIVEADEGSVVDVTANFAKPFTSGTPETLLINALQTAEAAGYPLGLHESAKLLSTDPSFDFTTLTTSPDTIRASVRHLVDEAARLLKAKWWIQNGLIHMRRATALPTSPPVIIPAGAVVSVSHREKNKIQAVCFSNPGIEPGALVQLPDQPPVVVITTQHSGDTRDGRPWLCTFVAQGAV